MEKKQSSIDWLEQNMPDLSNYIPIGVSIQLLARFQQAKAMHKEERFQDFKEGFQAALESLQGANNLVQSKKLGGDNE